MAIKIAALIISALVFVGCGTYTGNSGARVRCDRTLGSHLCSRSSAAAPVRSGKADPVRPRQAGTPAGKQL